MEHSSWGLFATVFGLIFLAELPDKTAFASVIMAAQRPALPVLLGTCLAFLVHGFIAIAFGSVLGLLPALWVHVGAGLLFLGFAVAMWRRGQEDEDEAGGHDAETFWKTVVSSFAVIFVAEWGDLTQLAMATLAAQYHSPVIILTSSVLALWGVATLGVVLGARLKHLINPAVLNRVAAVAFAAVGLWMLEVALVR